MDQVRLATRLANRWLQADRDWEDRQFRDLPRFTNSKGCAPSEVSFAWVDPRGKMYTNISDHLKWAQAYLERTLEPIDWDRMSWEPEYEEKMKKTPSYAYDQFVSVGQGSFAMAWLLSQGWVKMVNAFVFASSDLKSLSRGTITAVVDAIVDCTIQNRVDPERHKMLIEIFEHPFPDQGTSLQRWTRHPTHLIRALRVLRPSVADFVSRYGTRDQEERLYSNLL